jgi:hypothetical protein
MPDIKIERIKAHRVITAILRGKLSPPDVIAVATAICDGLIAATPERPSVSRRSLSRYPDRDTKDAFKAAVCGIVQHVDGAQAEKIWEAAFDLGNDLPKEIGF